MSELKYYKLFHRASALTSPEFISVVEFGTDDEVYLKSEADKVIAELEKKIKLYEDLGSCLKGCPALRHNQRRVESEMYKVGLKEKEIAELKKEMEYTLEHTTEVINTQEREIRHQEYKRCLAMAKWCEAELFAYPPFGTESPKEKWWQKWHERWLELAEKFKVVQ